MGGRGSGRYEYASTPTVEECRHLDVDDLKEFTEGPGAEGVVRWGDREDPEASIAVRSDGEAPLDDAIRAGWLRLQYTTTDRRTAESESHNDRVDLEYTACHFGGYRPWIRCPGCETRRRKLYLPPRADRFRCRECFDLGYRTSRTSGDAVKQAELRYRRAFAKADKDARRPHPNGDPYLPERPSGMHYDTFDDLLADVRDAREEWASAFDSRCRALLEDYGPA